MRSVLRRAIQRMDNEAFQAERLRKRHMVAGNARVLAVLCIGITLAAPLTAQMRRIVGKVLDENNNPAAQARVEVSPLSNSASVAADASAPKDASATKWAATSDATGQFILLIPSGGHYKLRAECVGYFLFSSPDIELQEGLPLEIRLNHQKDLTQTVDVRYSPPVIDPEQTADVKHLTNAEILNIPYPASQDFRSSLPLLPGAVQDNSGQIHFNGGDTRQTNFRLNGFDISDPATGSLTTRLNVDTVQTLEWQASRFSPENGKGSAGTLDVRTEMGDDHWTFTGTNFVPGFGSHEGFHLDRWNPRVKLSGPLSRGRAWFHDAFDAHYTRDYIPGLPSGQDQTRSVNGSNLARFQWNWAKNQNLTGSFLTNLAQDVRHGLSFLDPVQTTLNNRSSLYMPTVRDQITIGGGLLEVGFANTAGYLRSSPQGDQPYFITPFGNRGNYFVDSTRHSGRQEWLINGFVKPLHARGTHQIQVGADAEHSTLDELDMRHQFSVLSPNGQTVRTVNFLGNPRQASDNVEVYGYAVDRWNPVESLTLEIGFRTQWDKYSGGAPPAPRFSSAYSPRWLHGLKVSGGWGIFYDPLRLNVIALGQDQASLTTFFTPNGGLAGPPVTTQFLLRPRDLRLPKYTLASLSLEHSLPFDFYGRLNLTSREGSRGVTFLNDFGPYSPADGVNEYVLSNIRRERYRSAEFSVRRVFASKYEWFGSYTRSQARSNAAVDYTIENPVFAHQAPGPLPWDTPNRFLMWGWAPVEKRWFPHFLQAIVGETSLSGMIDYRTGFPFSAVTETGYLVGGPNSYRFPDFCSLNLALERKFVFRRYLWAWRVGLINSLNRLNPNVVNNDADSPQFLTYGRGQARAFNVRLRFLGRT